MANRVVHLDEESHDKLKRLAKQTGRPMSALVEQLINEAVAGVIRIAPVGASGPMDPVPKKKLSDPPPPPQVDTDEALRRPPFWQGRRAPGEGDVPL